MTPRDVDGFLALTRPRVIAHRGFSGRYPENTLVAFRAAVGLGVDMLELDVRLTADGEVAVVHDDVARGKTLAELAASGVPSLDEVLDLGCLLDVELKEEGVVEAAVGRVRGRGATGRVLLSSFEPAALRRARDLDPAIRRGALFNAELHPGLTAAAILDEAGAVSLHLAGNEVTAELVSGAHALGRPVLAYTVNDVSEAERLLRMGVDGLFTDRPDLLLEHLAG